MGKINNAKIGTYWNLYYYENWNRKESKKQKYLDEFIIQCLKDFYLQGLSSTQISKKYNVKSNTVRQWNCRFKYCMQYRFDREGGICDQLKGIINLKDYVCLELPNHRIGKYTGKYKEIANMYLEGFTYNEICNKLNVTGDLVGHVRQRFDLPRRNAEPHTLDFMW